MICLMGSFVSRFFFSLGGSLSANSWKKWAVGGQQAKTVSKTAFSHLIFTMSRFSMARRTRPATSSACSISRTSSTWGFVLGWRGGEHRAAVLIGQNGGIEGADMAGDADDLLLIHADEGCSTGRVAASSLTASAAMVWLATCPRHSPVTSAPAAQLMGQSVRQTHHEPAHDEGEVILRQLRRISSWISAKGTTWTVRRPHHGTSSRASCSTFSRACSLV